jgi:hypothetical protein
VGSAKAKYHCFLPSGLGGSRFATGATWPCEGGWRTVRRFAFLGEAGVVEAIGGRLIGGVIWTILFPVIVAACGNGITMAALAIGAVITCLVVIVFAPETRGRSVEALEADVAAKACRMWLSETSRPDLRDCVEQPSRDASQTFVA